MNYCIDLDNTLCITEGNNYRRSIPIPEAIAKVNRLYDAGERITIFTGRGSRSGRDWRALTVSQLFKWGVKYHVLNMQKPTLDILIDDKAINTKDWMNGQDKLGGNHS
jgi:CMP-N,N'-diacetyllegionaminic acid synthase